MIRFLIQVLIAIRFPDCDFSIDIYAVVSLSAHFFVRVLILRIFNFHHCSADIFGDIHLLHLQEGWKWIFHKVMITINRYTYSQRGSNPTRHLFSSCFLIEVRDLVTTATQTVSVLFRYLFQSVESLSRLSTDYLLNFLEDLQKSRKKTYRWSSFLLKFEDSRLSRLSQEYLCSHCLIFNLTVTQKLWLLVGISS